MFTIKQILTTPKFKEISQKIISNRSPALLTTNYWLQCIYDLGEDELNKDFFKHHSVRTLYRELFVNRSSAAITIQRDFVDFLLSYGCDLKSPFFDAWLDQDAFDRARNGTN